MPERGGERYWHKSGNDPEEWRMATAVLAGSLRISNEGECAIWTWSILYEERPLGRLQHLVSSPEKMDLILCTESP
jgi:hypothetical protein